MWRWLISVAVDCFELRLFFWAFGQNPIKYYLTTIARRNVIVEGH